MPNLTYREAEEHLMLLLPFISHGIRAQWIDGTYVVKSYDTPIARYHNGVVWINTIARGNQSNLARKFCRRSLGKGLPNVSLSYTS